VTDFAVAAGVLGGTYLLGGLTVLLAQGALLCVWRWRAELRRVKAPRAGVLRRVGEGGKRGPRIFDGPEDAG
jgi:hypothetical protein